MNVAAYGLDKAPRACRKQLRKELKTVGLTCRGDDPCLMRLVDKKGKVVGAACVQVDDLLTAGAGAYLEDVINRLCKALPFGDRKYGEFGCTGSRYTDHVDFSVEVDQAAYIDRIEEFSSSDSDTDKLTTDSISRFNGKIGELNRTMTQTRAHASFNASFHAGCNAAPGRAGATRLNKTVRRIKQQREHLNFRKIARGRLEDIVVVVPQGAGWAARKSGHSQAGALTRKSWTPSTRRTTAWIGFAARLAELCVHHMLARCTRLSRLLMCWRLPCVYSIGCGSAGRRQGSETRDQNLGVQLLQIANPCIHI